MVTTRLVASGVCFVAHVKAADQTTVTVVGILARDGHIEVRPPTPGWRDDPEEWAADVARRREYMQDVLIDAGLADFRQVAPGESEFYAEDKLLNALHHSLGAMPRDPVLL